MSAQPNGTNNMENPGLIAGHAQYVKGAAESTIGALTGAQAWATSGEQDKNQAIDAMKAAGEKRESGNAPGEGQGIVGGVEEAAGKLVGCEGMKREGAEGKKE